jgi:predicted nucleic acid-binding protein
LSARVASLSFVNPDPVIAEVDEISRNLAVVSLRPTTLKEIAERSDSIADFGRHLRDWLHALRRISSRTQAAAAIVDEPPLLENKFTQGGVADAWLAAYAEHLAGKIGQPAPEWAFAPARISADPIFDDGANRALQMLALIRAPFAFKRRNIFTPAVDLPLTLRAGRPAKSAEEKRKTNADRQRRFREARRHELESLRKLAGKHSGLNAATKRRV